jgi:hypothetical protein
MSDPTIEITQLFKEPNINFVIYDLSPVILSVEELTTAAYMAKIKNSVRNEYPDVVDEFVPRIRYTLLGRYKTKNSNPSELIY